MGFTWTEISKANDPDGLGLQDAFRRCHWAQRNLGELPRDATAAQSALDSAVALTARCEELVEIAALFSPNEDKEDIPTSSLRYLLLPFLAAELTGQCRVREPRPRLKALSLAERHYRSFLRRCQKYELLPAVVTRALERLESDEAADPRLLRDEKVQQRREEKAILASIARLEEQACSDDDAREGGNDEERERELWLATIQHSSIESVSTIALLRQEQEMLLHMLRTLDTDVDPAQQAAEEEAKEADARARNAMRTKLFEIAGGLGGTSKRQQLGEQVFRPDHILPTYTVEQAGAMELKEAQERQQREDANARRQAQIEAAKSNDQKEDEEVEKQRQWDDWKDDNPTGWGNSKLRPCAL